jgi:glycosyltransferase involved in cell wall biosynthesis
MADVASPRFSIITTCMGRLEHLRRSLPAMVEQGADVVVVDYSCPDRCGDWVQSAFPQVRVVRVEGKTRFHAAHARNCGAAAAQSDWLLFLDADRVLAPGFADAIGALMSPGTFHHPSPLTTRLGQLLVAATDFHGVGGYDEVIRDWGGEDTDLSRRLGLAGLSHVGMPDSLMGRIEHGDELRVANYDVAQHQRSNTANLVYVTLKLDLMRLTGRGLPEQQRRTLYDTVRDTVFRVLDTGRPESLRTGLPRRKITSLLALQQTLVYQLLPRGDGGIDVRG